MANTPHEPDDKTKSEVEAYAAVGVPHHDIAKLVGISIKTLLKYYDHELGVGKAKANAQVAKSLFKQAINGNIAAAIFWMKAQANWSEKQVIEHSGNHSITMYQVGNARTLANTLRAVEFIPESATDAVSEDSPTMGSA